MYNLLFWISIQLLLLWTMQWATRTYRNRRFFKLAISPAVLVDAQMRLGCCCVGGRTVTEVAFFDDGKPFLREGPSKFQYFGQILYLLLWQGGAFYLFQYLATGLTALDAMSLSLPHVDPGKLSQGVVDVDAREYLEGFRYLLNTAHWGDWKLWAFLYFMAAFFPCLSIDGKQLRWGAVVVGIVALITAAAIFMGLRPGFLSRGWWLNWWVLPDFFRVYSLYVSLLAVAVVGHVTVRLTWLALCQQARASVQRMAKKKEKEKKPEKGPKKEAQPTH